KYGALPELLPEKRLVQGNAFVEMGTFLAILLGTIAGGVLAQGSRATLAAVVLSLLPELVKDHLGGGPTVVTFMLGAFSVGVGLGAFVCEKLSFEQIELGLVPLG